MTIKKKFDCSILELKIGSVTDLSRIREFKKMYIREIGDEIISKEIILDEAS